MINTGDKIALSDPASDTSSSGSSTWFVEKVTLFTTTVRFATTNEVATYSNGSLARLRIINAKRSPKAVLYVYVKFGSDAPYQKLKLFRSAIENFVKARPREVRLAVGESYKFSVQQSDLSYYCQIISSGLN